MGIRETLNENPRLMAGITGGVILLVLIFIVRSLWPESRPTALPSNERVFVFVSEDSPNTFIPGTLTQIPPFDKDGKKLVRARVFRCGNEKPFAGWLEKYDDRTKAKLDKFYSDPNNPARNSERQMMTEMQSLLIKKPGDAKWTSMRTDSTAASAVQQVTCPNGAQPEEVLTQGQLK